MDDERPTTFLHDTGIMPLGRRLERVAVEALRQSRPDWFFEYPPREDREPRKPEGEA